MHRPNCRRPRIAVLLLAIAALDGTAPRPTAAQEENSGHLVYVSSTVTYLIGDGSEARLEAPEVDVNGVYAAAMELDLKRATLAGRMLISDLDFGINSPGSIQAEWRRSVKGKPSKKLARATEALGGNDRFAQFFVDKPARKLKNAVLSANYKARNGRFVAPSLVAVTSRVDIRALLGRWRDASIAGSIGLLDYDQAGLRRLTKLTNTQAVSLSASFELQPSASREVSLFKDIDMDALVPAAEALSGTNQVVCIRLRLSNSTPPKSFSLFNAWLAAEIDPQLGVKTTILQFEEGTEVGEDIERTVKITPEEFLFAAGGQGLEAPGIEVVVDAENDEGTQLFVEVEVIIPGTTNRKLSRFKR